ncbi:MAG: hypothetical protein ACLT98_17410 [Eggerthellaceae bacterium]
MTDTGIVTGRPTGVARCAHPRTGEPRCADAQTGFAVSGEAARGLGYGPLVERAAADELEALLSDALRSGGHAYLAEQQHVPSARRGADRRGSARRASGNGAGRVSDHAGERAGARSG